MTITLIKTIEKDVVFKENGVEEVDFPMYCGRNDIGVLPQFIELVYGIQPERIQIHISLKDNGGKMIPFISARVNQHLCKYLALFDDGKRKIPFTVGMYEVLEKMMNEKGIKHGRGEIINLYFR